MSTMEHEAQSDLIEHHPSEGFTGEITWEIEQNSRGVNVRIRGNVMWQNESRWDSPVEMPGQDFMVPLGSRAGEARMPLRAVIQSLTEEARAGIAKDLAALKAEGGAA